MTDIAMRSKCDTCGRFLAFADLCFSEHHFTPLNEFGPEESSFTGPCCRYRTAPVDTDRQAETHSGSGRSLGSAVAAKRTGAKPQQRDNP
jgi:hypothetical protein